MKVFREKLKEYRGEYYVIYQPADARLKFAAISLVFFRDSSDIAAIATAMERELDSWLGRFPVATMVSSFDAKDDLISLKGYRDDDHLTGYPSKSAGVVSRWQSLRDNEIPSELTDEQYLEQVYAGVPCRLAEEVRRDATAKAKALRRGASLILFFVIVVPVLIQLASVGIAWFGTVISVISILFGLYRAAKAFGWIQPSEREKQKAEKQRKMEHYFHHCEENPEGFNRLKMENFEREAVQRTQAEASALQDQTGDPK